MLRSSQVYFKGIWSLNKRKGEFEKYKEKTGKESFIDFYNENPDEFDSLATEAVLTMAYPGLKAVKYLAKYGTKVALRVVYSAGKLGVKANSEIADFADLSKRILGNEIGAVGDIGKALRKSYAKESHMLKKVVN